LQYEESIVLSAQLTIEFMVSHDLSAMLSMQNRARYKASAQFDLCGKGSKESALDI